MASWPRQLGELHGQRDGIAATEAQARREADQQRCGASLERWPAIVAAVKSLIDAYNDGAGGKAVAVLEDHGHPAITVESTTNGRRMLVIALDGPDITVRSRPGPNEPLSRTQWVSLERTNENAAEYLLRDWLEHL